MTYQSLYRKYRPQLFEDVIGQETIVTALTNAVLKNKISHAYLFTGPRGTGKTTTAKLLAKAINCESPDKVICGVCDNCIQAQNNSHPDIVEIDAASNNGVEEIRSLIERVKFTPIVGKYKVYIIDEIHMLSQGAFNALLKTLEEPPSHVVFILATTEIHKVLATIISRCQRFDFSRINTLDIAKKLDELVLKEQRTIEPNASSVIASLSGGGMRNALTILEQAMVLSDDIITVQSIYENNGMVLPEEKINLFKHLKNEDISKLLQTLKVVMNKTVDVSRFVMDLVAGLKDSLVYGYTKNDAYINVNDKSFVVFLQTNYKNKEIIKFINILLDYHEKIRFSSTPFVHFEIAMIELYEMVEKVASFKQESPIIDVASKDTNSKREEAAVETIGTDDELVQVEMGEDVFEEALEITSSVTPSLFDDLPETIDTKETLEIKKETIPDEQPEPYVEPAKESEGKNEDKDDEIVTETISEPANKAPLKSILKLDLSTEEIVQYMVSADKELRMGDEAHFENLKDYLSTPQWAKESKLLNNTKIAMSGASFILVVTNNQSQSRAILDEVNMYDLISFTEELLGSPKQVFAVTDSQFKVAVEVFRDLSSKNQLPEPLSPSDFITGNEDYVDEKEKRIMDLFGDQVEIKES